MQFQKKDFGFTEIDDRDSRVLPELFSITPANRPCSVNAGKLYKLLKQNYGSKEKEIFELNLELIRSVYKEPQYLKSKSGFSAKVSSSSLNAEAELNNNKVKPPTS